MAESPSALLERAAARLELLAGCFDGYLREADQEAQRGQSPVECWVHDTVAPNMTRTTKQWVATMNPTVAAPLIDWLRAEAERVKGIRAWKHLMPRTNRAVAFARAVLGEPAEETS